MALLRNTLPTTLQHRPRCPAIHTLIAIVLAVVLYAADDVKAQRAARLSDPVFTCEGVLLGVFGVEMDRETRVVCFGASNDNLLPPPLFFCVCMFVPPPCCWALVATD